MDSKARLIKKNKLKIKSEPVKSETHLPITFEPTNIVLTGKPGVGKTTLIKSIIDHLQQCGTIGCCGFYTNETRDTANERTGFEIITLDGKESTLAKTFTFDDVRRPKIGKYSVYVENVDAVALAIRNAPMNKLLVLDEIGKMELMSKSFRSTVNDVIDHTLLLATIPLIYSIPMLERLRSSPNTKLFCITKSNRNTIFKEIVDCIEECLKVN
ncbi:nucleoside-triphosphatase THEP1-like isoform X1 [Teleopsis dalmanni]|uniref:nucleoside-triphosphatase THEP1-like isoform X1 n=1 Tax=Teleopsis dalmanni TaxID=139649 RepID=UPI0018CFB541|nr:nucleoside-triphosphatase THEP1-like isoform X1 [Teleopsis dalmanni]XP_037939530.1 nucleoside-triphosphatase THEP1-like isoform X1 [Teleopsis dalmanni]XP_037939532.1 nucleoside-triphosphatase THEP1-like isoform X1 [Teleopsis dalmanni]